MMSLNHMAETNKMIVTGKGEGRKVYRTRHLHAIQEFLLGRLLCISWPPWVQLKTSFRKNNLYFQSLLCTRHSRLRHVILQHGPQIRGTPMLDLQHQNFVFKSQALNLRFPISMNRLQTSQFLSWSWDNRLYLSNHQTSEVSDQKLSSQFVVFCFSLHILDLRLERERFFSLGNPNSLPDKKDMCHCLFVFVAKTPSSDKSIYPTHASLPTKLFIL